MRCVMVETRCTTFWLHVHGQERTGSTSATPCFHPVQRNSRGNGMSKYPPNPSIPPHPQSDPPLWTSGPSLATPGGRAIGWAVGRACGWAVLLASPGAAPMPWSAPTPGPAPMPKSAPWSTPPPVAAPMPYPTPTP